MWTKMSLQTIVMGILAYWVVNTIRYKLKQMVLIIHSWKEIVRIMNTQKVVTTTAMNDKEQCISIRRCSEPTEKVKLIYDALAYKYAPFIWKKICSARMDSEKMGMTVNERNTG